MCTQRIITNSYLHLNEYKYFNLLPSQVRIKLLEKILIKPKKGIVDQTEFLSTLLVEDLMILLNQ